MPSTPSTPSIATIAEYFRQGIRVGLIQPETAIAWADTQIAATEQPVLEVIDVAWAKGSVATMDALAAVPGERDKSLAGRWLLAELGKTDLDSEDLFMTEVQRAFWIAREAGLDDDVCYQFNAIDDLVSLSLMNVSGTIEQCKVEFASALQNASCGAKPPESISTFR